MNTRFGAVSTKLAGLIAGLVLCVFLLGEGITTEVPIGGLDGRVLMRENGRPIKNIQVNLRELPIFGWKDYSLLPEESAAKSYAEFTDNEGHFSFRNVKAGRYEIQAQAESHDAEPVIVTVSEGKPATIDLELKPNDPYMDIYTNQHVYRPEEKLQVQIHGFVQADSLDFVAYKLDWTKMSARSSLYDTFGPFNRGSLTPKQRAQILDVTAAEWTSPIHDKSGEGNFKEFFTMPKLPEGDYWVECKGGSFKKGTWISVSRIALVTKAAGKEMMCFVATLDDGEPVAGATLFKQKNGLFVPSGKTGADGTARLQISGDSNDMLCLAKSGNSSALVGLYSGDEEASNARIVVYTDRPIYRPGDEVQFKGIVRKIAGPRYALPSSRSVDIEIRDSGETMVKRETLPLSAMGTFHGSFDTNQEAEPGLYSITTKYDGDEDTKRVTLAAYRKPEYTVNVKPEQGRYVKGDKVRFVIDSQYYFGAPVAGATVEAHFNLSPHWSWMNVDSEDSSDYGDYESEYGHYNQGGENIKDVTAMTDENGKAVIELDTSRGGDYAANAWDDETDTELTLNVDVTDGDKYASGDSSVVIARGNFDLSISTENYVSDIGKPAKYVVSTKKADGSGLANVRVKIISGYDLYTGIQRVYKPQDTMFVTTGADGTASIELTSKHPGYFQVHAEATDERGNTIAARQGTFIWSQGFDYGDFNSSGQGLTIQLDKPQYNVGDTARIVLTTDKPGGYALLTIEGERLYSSRIVKLDSKVVELSIPVSEELRPNAFVAACSVRDKVFHQTQRRLKVDLAAKTINVKVSTDKPLYAPGGIVHYAIQTLSAQGKPISAEISLGVVDESIYALAADSTNLLRSFYPGRSNAVRTNYSFEEIYLDGGDKAPKNIQIRKDFRDTAAWRPVIQTDANGRASADIQLPDNLTTWRATVCAVTSNTDVGMAISKVRAKKDLMVRLQTPRYLVQGDTQRLLAMVTNDTDADANVSVQLDPPPAPVKGDLRQAIRVPAGGTRSVEWQLSVPDPGDKTFIVKAWVQNGASDGEQKTIQVQPHARLFVDSSAGDLRQNAKFNVNVRQGADPNSGSVTITISPNIASSLVQSLDELIGYPYGCVEQTMSRFLPTVVVSRAVTEAHLPAIPQLKKVPEIVANGFTRLKTMRHTDGAWGWWEYDDSDVFMTSLVLEGLKRADQAGYPARGIAVKSALDWLAQKVIAPYRSDKDWYYYDDVTSRLYGCLVLAMYGREEDFTKGLAYLPLKEVGPYESAMLALTYHYLGPKHASDCQATLRLMRSLVNETPGIAYWPERYWGHEATARCLLAMATITPQDPMIPKIVRGLMMSRSGDMWDSTRDTSYILIALTEWWRATGGIANSGQISVSANGQNLRTIAVSAQTIFNPDLKVRIPLRNLKQGDNAIEISSTSLGTIYYGVETRQFVVEDALGALTSGPDLTIARSNVLVSPQRLEDGTLKLVESKPMTSANRGDFVRTKVTVSNAKDIQYVMIEIPVPSNCHVTERETLDEYENWSYDYDKIVIRDDRVAFFVRRLPAGEHTYSFNMRAESPGRSSALPATVYNMYDPGKRASTAESSLEVRGQ